MSMDERTAHTTGLRALADFLDEHPDVPLPYIQGINAFVYGDDIPERLAVIAAAMSPCEKHVYGGDGSGGFFTLVKNFGPAVSLHVNAARETVCERVATTETVTEQVPDPDALAAVPIVEITREVEKVEWVCPPSILAAAADREQDPA